MDDTRLQAIRNRGDAVVDILRDMQADMKTKLQAEMNQIDPATAMIVIAVALTGNGLLKDFAAFVATVRAALYFPTSTRPGANPVAVGVPVSKKLRQAYIDFHNNDGECADYEQGIALKNVTYVGNTRATGALNKTECKKGGKDCTVMLEYADGRTEPTPLVPYCYSHANAPQWYGCKADSAYRLNDATLRRLKLRTDDVIMHFHSEKGERINQRAITERARRCERRRQALAVSADAANDKVLKACGYTTSLDARRESPARRLARYFHGLLVPFAHMAFVGACGWTLSIRLLHLRSHPWGAGPRSPAWAIVARALAAGLATTAVLVGYQSPGDCLPATNEVTRWLNEPLNEAALIGIGVALVVGGRALHPALVDAVLLTGALVQVIVFATGIL